MKVLFLDIDGVLNSAEFMLNKRHIRRPTPHEIDAVTVPRLNSVIARTGAKICVSSTWRIGRDAMLLEEILRSHGVRCDVVGTTPETFRMDNERGWSFRGNEIQMWLDRHPEVSTFAIVDDDSDMEPLMHRLVKTSWETGLLDEHVEKLVEMLGPITSTAVR